MVELTPEQKKLMEAIIEARKDFESVRTVYYGLLHQCEKNGHVIIPRDPDIEEKLKSDMWACCGAICAVCGSGFMDLGWWCPKSPDHLCHYSKSEDDCDYCHMPSERE